jgi:hypothetical protein
LSWGIEWHEVEEWLHKEIDREDISQNTFMPDGLSAECPPQCTVAYLDNPATVIFLAEKK